MRTVDMYGVEIKVRDSFGVEIKVGDIVRWGDPARRVREARVIRLIPDYDRRQHQIVVDVLFDFHDEPYIDTVYVGEMNMQVIGGVR